MDSIQRLQNFRKKRETMLATTTIADADNKIARTDSIELYFLKKAWLEVSDNLQRFYH